MQISHPWQKQLAESITELDALFKLLGLDLSYLERVTATNAFRLRVPMSFVNRMKKQDIHDPLLQQILPLKEESVVIPGFSQDPLQEKSHNPLPGLIHKYPSRVLLTPTGACAVHCRYCFRRYFPYEENNPHGVQQKEIIHYITQHPEVNEVIFSGGDPLVMTDKTLGKWIDLLEALPQLNYLRFHTRLPIVLPDRITDEFVTLLAKSKFQIILVVHCNHPQEVDASVLAALTKLTQANITVLNQAVLLKNINDHAAVLAELNRKLFNAKVLPYYLHLLDKVSGTQHFEVEENRAKAIWHELCTLLPGYLVPRLAREAPGHRSKLWVI